PIPTLSLHDALPISYNAAYVEDHDNYIDIILSGDEAAVRQITAVEIPASGGYLPFYNPGGPGNAPTPGVAYTTAGPAHLEPVMRSEEHTSELQSRVE